MDPDPDTPDYDLRTREGMLRRAIETTDARIPALFRGATVTHPEIVAWCDAFGSGTSDRSGLLILGPTGVGKTHQAYGAMRKLAASGMSVAWRAITAPDLTARLRPSATDDPEGEFWRWASSPLLIVDDFGAGKTSEWVEKEVNYRLVNHRYEEMLPTLVLSNLPVRSSRQVPSLETALGERVVSRISGMCKQIAIKGADRRKASR